MRISLKAARVDKGLSQKELAIAVGVTKKTVGAWESGKSMPKADKIDLLCQVLCKTYDDIRWKV